MILEIMSKYEIQRPNKEITYSLLSSSAYLEDQEVDELHLQVPKALEK